MRDLRIHWFVDGTNSISHWLSMADFSIACIWSLSAAISPAICFVLSKTAGKTIVAVLAMSAFLPCFSPASADARTETARASLKS